jgi:hypothetical protein
MQAIVVLDYGTPRQRLLAWFLSDNGFAVQRIETLDDVMASCQQEDILAVIVNSTVTPDEASEIIAKLRAYCPHAVLFHIHEDATPPSFADPNVYAFEARDVKGLVARLRELGS